MNPKPFCPITIRRIDGTPISCVEINAHSGAPGKTVCCMATPPNELEDKATEWNRLILRYVRDWLADGWPLPDAWQANTRPTQGQSHV